MRAYSLVGNSRIDGPHPVPVHIMWTVGGKGPPSRLTVVPGGEPLAYELNVAQGFTPWAIAEGRGIRHLGSGIRHPGAWGSRTTYR